MISKIFIHMILEAIGGGVAYYAYGFCHHWRHRIAVYFVLSLIFSIVTVHLVG